MKSKESRVNRKMMGTFPMEPILRVVNLSKSFGTLPAVQHVSFEVQPGEVVGLTGSIGSGKSVLAMLLAGLYESSEGDIYFANKHLNWPYVANSLGIGVIHQRYTLNDQFDVVSNIFLGNEIGWPVNLRSLRIIDSDRMIREAMNILTQLGMDANIIHEKMINLSGEQRQMIAIARVLTNPYRMIIIDEPTVLLSYPYQQRLLGMIQNWRQQGVAVVFSSSNLDDLFAVTDRIIILDQGRKAADLRTDETTREIVLGLLLGGIDTGKPSQAVWDFDSYDRIREHAEKMRYHQMLLGKNLAAEDILQNQLVEQLTEQVQSLDQANLALLEAQRRLLSEREQERKHLSRELHDQIIQDLLSVNYELEEMVTENSVLPGLANDLSEVREGIRELVDDLRRICGDLRPLTIDSLGLGAALQSFTRDWSARTGIKVELEVDANLGRLPEAAELSIFRIVQEGLNNVWKHAHASLVQISLQHSSPRTLMVSLRDNGLGLAEDLDLSALATHGHYGLIGIGERVTLLGGRFRLLRLPEGGSQLLVEIPHPRVEVNADVVS
jgi:signal transduction histidine kinase